MQEPNTNCIRCGTVRVFSRKWKDRENGKGNVVTHVRTVCPDSACQKIVDEKFQQMADIRINADEKRKSVILARSNKKKLFIS